MIREYIKNIIREKLNESYYNEFSVKNLAFNKDIDLSRFFIDDVVKGFNVEHDFHKRIGTKISAEDMLKNVISNLKTDESYYDKYEKSLAKNTKKNVSEIRDSKKLCHKLIIKNGVDNIDHEKLELLKKFISFVSSHLGLKVPCSIYLSSERNNHLETTASYNRINNNIWIYVKNRNMLGDILRSIAHEMMHLKQNTLGQLNHSSGEDGSPQENEANSFSGLMIRKFGRENRTIYQ